jgi:hypothetical protein
MTALTAIVWNTETLLELLDADLSFLLLAAMVVFLLPLVPIIYSVVKLTRIRHSTYETKRYKKNWLTVLLVLNGLYYTMLAGCYLGQGRIPYPDAAGLVDAGYYNVFIKPALEREARDYASEYLHSAYGDNYSPAVTRTNRHQNGGKLITLQLYESSHQFYFTLTYNGAAKNITGDDFKTKLVRAKINARVKELIDACIGDGLTLYVRWDGLNTYVEYPPSASADDILSGKYGKQQFTPVIFIRADDVSRDRAKEMYLSILKNYCFANMNLDSESLSSQMSLIESRFSLHFINEAQYEKAWVNTTHPGEGECMDAYEIISCGYIGDLAEDPHAPTLDTEQIYKAARQYLDDHYGAEKW